MVVRSITTAVAGLALTTVAGQAQNWTQGSETWTKDFYATIGAAYSFQQDTTLTETGIPIPASGTATFNPGFRGDVTLGYNINKSWAAECDAGVIWNSMDTFLGQSMDSSGQTFDTYTIPILGKVVYRLPFKGRWSAFVGAGGGGAASILHYTSSVYDPGDYTFVFAYQAEAGLSYALSKNASLGLAYQFFGTTDPSWQFTVNYVGPLNLPPTQIGFKESGFYTHSITLTFSWRF